jgi:hypothetical protein
MSPVMVVGDASAAYGFVSERKAPLTPCGQNIQMR